MFSTYKFSLSETFQTIRAAQPVSCSLSTELLTRENVCHFLPSIVEAKNELSYNSAPLICLHGSNKGTLTFTIYYVGKWRRVLVIFCNGTEHYSSIEVACWLLVPKFAGSNPAEAVGFFGAKKSSARLHSEGR